MNEMQTHGLLIPVGSKPNHDDNGSNIGNSRPIDREYPISH